MAGKNKWVATVGIDYYDTAGTNHRVEIGEPYDGPLPEWLTDNQYVVPASAAADLPSSAKDEGSAG